MKKSSSMIFVFMLNGILVAQESKKEPGSEELARELANPIASLISVPLQNNNDFGIGLYDGSRSTTNIQPVVPFALSDNLNLILRWVQPVIAQYSINDERKSQFGLGDAVVSGFISPQKSKNGLTWGAGPVFLVPAGTEELFSTKKLGFGPTAVILKQLKGSTFGALMNQIWSIAGKSDRPDVSQLFVQPFFTYNWKSGAGIGANLELSQDWHGNKTTLWFNPTLSGLTSVGKQMIQLLVGPRFNLTSSSANKADWGVRTALVFLFPKQ